ncbi:MAG TPA: hypothetical protein VH684_25525 [Xanthobacteraceae bacterium]|jgi:hypothetical protein
MTMDQYHVHLIRWSNWELALQFHRNPKPATRTELQVAGVLDCMTDKSRDGIVQISVDNLAFGLKRTPKTISGCLHRLVERGAVKLIEPAKSHQAARYAVDYDWANTWALKTEQMREMEMAA